MTGRLEGKMKLNQIPCPKCGKKSLKYNVSRMTGAKIGVICKSCGAIINEKEIGFAIKY